MDHSGPSEAAPTTRGLAAGDLAFKRFRLRRLLGRGGMGVVWLAHDEALDSEVALKFLPDTVRWDPAALAALRQETRRSRELTHPHIVRVHDIHEDAGAAAIAMEYLAGGSLHQQRMTRTPPVFTCAEIMAWLPDLCAALDHAHAQGVVHRDLKPSNLLRSDRGAVKISDFGIAQPLFETALRLSQWAPSGTLAYMSPQQQFGEPAGPADDVYALGATLYELLASKPPFYTGNLAAQIERRVPDSVGARRRQLGIDSEAVPQTWEKILARCLAKRAEERPARAMEIAAELCREPGPATRRPKGIWRASRRRWPWLAGGIVCAVAAGLLSWREVHERAPVLRAPSHESDAMRASAAWNLDGDGKEAAGRGWDLRAMRVVPTPDRHGRVDRAIAFTGSGGMDLAAPGELRWARNTPFSVSVWVRPEGEGGLNGALVALRGERAGEACWDLRLDEGRPYFASRSMQVDDADIIFGNARLASGAWGHVVAVHDGGRIRVYLNGRAVGEAGCRPDARGTMPRSATLMIGHEHRYDTRRFVGAMDQARIWRRALAPDEIASLAADGPAPRFALTRGVSAETVDLQSVVQREFGPAARLADWDDLIRWHRDDTRAWLDELGVAANAEGLYVQRGGQRWADGRRHYFVSRFDGTKPGYFRVHDEMGGMTLALGSWYGLTMRALVQRPSVDPERIKLHGSGGLQHNFDGSGTLATGVIGWRKVMTPPGDSPPVVAEATLTTRDGGQWRARCAVAPDGALTLTLGNVDRPQRVRQLVATYGPTEFTLIWRDRQLVWRAVSAESGTALFEERLALEDFFATDVTRLTVAGVDAGELTLER